MNCSLLHRPDASSNAWLHLNLVTIFIVLTRTTKMSYFNPGQLVSGLWLHSVVFPQLGSWPQWLDYGVCCDGYAGSDPMTPPSGSGNFFSIQARNEGTSSAMLLGRDEFVTNRGMLPAPIRQRRDLTS